MKFTSLLIVVLLLCLSFGLGWWWRGTFQEPMPSITSTRTFPAANPLPSPSGSPDAAKPSATSAEVAAPTAPRTAPVARGLSAGELEAEDALEAFRKLLNSGQFSAAMQVYSRVDRSDPARAVELKAIVMTYLGRYLQRGEEASLTALIEAFLNYDYDDLDVLVLLARHHHQAGHPLEAARTFQLALAYAYESRQRQQVEQAFGEFVAAVDGALAGEGRWQELAGFYENLALLDLQWPQYSLRLAEVYLQQDQPVLARHLLTPLTDHPTLGEQAAALLGQKDRASAQTPVARAGASSVPLGVVGNHFDLALEVNRNASVRLIIDTGASTTTLARSTFENLSNRGGFTRLAPQMFNTANGPVRGEVYRAERVQLGQYQLHDINIAVLDFEMPNGVDGLLGMNVLRNFRFELDQEQQLLYLQER